MKRKKLSRRYWSLWTTFFTNCEPQHSFLHRQHLAAAAAQNRSAERCPDFVEDRKRESNRQHERPDGARDDRSSRKGWTTEAGCRGSRIHGRQHRRIVIARLRREGLSAAHRQLGRVRAGEARSHANPGRAAADREK